MGKGITGKWEWHDLVSTELRESLPKKEAKRQAITFELIKGEMAYVKDLEAIDTVRGVSLLLLSAYSCFLDVHPPVEGCRTPYHYSGPFGRLHQRRIPQFR